MSLVNPNVDVPAQPANLLVKLIQGAGGSLGIDRQRLRLQALVDLLQIFVDPIQLTLQRVELGLAGYAYADVGVIRSHLNPRYNSAQSIAAFELSSPLALGAD